MLKWMRLSDERIKNLIFGNHVLKIEDINGIYLPDSFLDDDVDIFVLYYFMKKDCFEQVRKLIQNRKSGIFTCGECVKQVVDECIQCDSCLLWFHYLCANIDASVDAILLDNDWFCSKCN